MLRSLLVGTRGGISAMAAVLFVALIGVSALAVEYGHGLLTQSENQRAADLAAFSGAVIYESNSSSTSLMQSAVNNVATLNGLSGDATGTIVTSPTGDGNNAVKVVVTTTEPLNLAHVITTSTSLSISAVSYAEIVIGGEPGCIMALSSSGTGITMTGGTAISAANCAVTSNNQVSVHCGDTITTQQLDYGTSLSDSCSGIQPPTGDTLKEAKKTAADPLAGSSAVAAARGGMSTVTALTDPAAPSGVPTGTDVCIGVKKCTTTVPSGCSSSNSGSTWTITCSGSGPFDFGNLQVQGGTTVNLNTGGSSSAVYNFSGSITFSSASALNFGPGTFNIAQGIYTSGAGTMSFGAGTFKIGSLPSTSSCTVQGESICHNSSGAFTIGGSGSSTFTLSGGIYVGGGDSLTMGSSGTSNTFDIGVDSNGASLDQAGGASATFGDGTSAGANSFQMAGNLNDSAGGGSCINIGAAQNHNIDGYMYVSGGITLGGGVYTVDDYVSAGGGGGGGDVTCNGVTTGINASGVTFVIGGNATTTCSDGSNQIFCLGAGYAHVTLTSPSCTGSPAVSSSALDPYCGFAVIGPSSGGGGADFSNGASSTKISGAFYLPTGPVVMSGAATVGDTSSGDCLELQASQITMTGGTATGSQCVTEGSIGSGGTATTISLVQ